LGELIQNLEKLGKKPQFIQSGGGSDANILRARGINAVNITSGMHNPHSWDEYIEVGDLVLGAGFVALLLTGKNIL